MQIQYKEDILEKIEISQMKNEESLIKTSK